MSEEPDASSNVVSLGLYRNLTWLEWLPQGWHGIYRTFVERLEAGYPGTTVTHAGQKLAFLQLLIRPHAEGVSALVDEAARASIRTCEECGAPGRPLIEDSGWLRALCPTHGEGLRPYRRRPPENRVGPSEDDPWAGF